MSVPTPAPASPPTPPPAPRNVPALLAKLLAEDFTGAVEVSGTPGGTIHLRRGLVIAAETPNAPSVETLLIRSGRIDQDQWAAALTRRAAATVSPATANGQQDPGDLNSVLVELDLIGQGELEAVCIAAVYDAAFAMALSPAQGWTVHKAALPPDLVTCPGESPRGLADETSRRISVLSQSWGSLAELAGARCRPAARVEPGLLTARQQAVLLAANGRRTPRDIAFFLGCGVFPAMLDIARLRARKLVEWEPPRAVTTPSTARRVPPPADSPGHPAEPVALPRRIRRDPTTEDLPGSSPTDRGTARER